VVDGRRGHWCGQRVGHALLHDPEVPATKELTRGLMELEAESTAFVVCAALGMETSDYSFGYVAGWAGGAPEAVQGIKASTSRIQRATSAVLKTFEVEQPEVEAMKDVSIEIVAEHSVDVDIMLRISEGATEGLVTPEPISEIGDAPNGSIQAILVDLPSRDAPAGSYHPFAGDQCGGLAVGVDAWRELGV